MSHRTNRRQFLRSTGLAGVGFWLASSAKAGTGPNDKIHIGVIGAGGRGAANTGEVLADRGVQIVALCDVNEQNLEQAATARRRRGQPAPQYSSL